MKSANARLFGAALICLATSVPDSAQSAKAAPQTAPEKSGAGILLEQLSWDEAERVLTPEQVVVIPLGAESKEHGRHLPLNNDWIMAEYFKQRVLSAEPVVVAPTINYSYYPSFLEYPGSTSLSSDTARTMIVDIIHSLAHYGPRRFYVINTGISTLRPLAAAAAELAKERVLLRYTDFTKENAVEKEVRQSGGTHADEIETSMMLYIAPLIVRMNRATRDLNPAQPGPLTRDPKGKGLYSPTGVWGDPTLATAEKGRRLVESYVAGILKEIEELKHAATSKAES